MANKLRQTIRMFAVPLMLGASVFFSLSDLAGAQASRDSGSANAPQGGIIVGGGTAPGPKFERCVDVQIGSDNALGCLNQNLKREVDRVNPSFNMPPLDARSPDTRVGNVNEAAIRQQYGSNYGRSVYPYRPPAGVYVAPRR